MKTLVVLAMFVLTLPISAGAPKPFELKAAACAVQEGISEDKKPLYTSVLGQVKFRFVKDGIPGTNQKDAGVSAVLIYALDGKTALIVHVRRSKDDGILVEPMFDVLDRQASGKWSPMDVEGGPNTGAATAAYASKLDRLKMKVMKPFLAHSCKIDE
jgi:hypothetical protein